MFDLGYKGLGDRPTKEESTTARVSIGSCVTPVAVGTIAQSFGGTYFELFHNNLAFLKKEGITLIDIDGDGLIGRLNFSGFNSLSTLNVSTNEVHEMNLDGCTSLSSLYASSTGLSKISLFDCKQLTTLVFNSNSIKTIDLRPCKGLETCYLDANLLSLVNFDGLSSLQVLSLSSNYLTNLNGLESNSLLTLNVTNNNFTGFDFSKIPKIKYLACPYNDLVTTLNTTLLTDLETLDCSWCGLTTISLDNDLLVSVNCSYNTGLSAINLSNLPALQSLNISSTSISYLGSFTGYPSIQTLTAINSAFSSLSLYGGNLQNVNLSSSVGLYSLSVTGATEITDLNISDTIANPDISTLLNLTNYDCNSCGISSLTLPNPTSSLASLLASSNSLSSLSLYPSVGITSLNLYYNTLNSYAVDAILIELDSFGTYSGYCNLQGGSNGVPTYGSSTAIANLTYRGWTLVLST